MYIYCPGSRNAVKRRPHGSEGWDAAVRRICLSRGRGRTACPGGHACGGTATAVFRRLCRRNVRPPFRCTQAPCRRGSGLILFFRGWERPSPKDRRICLAHPAGKAVLCPLHNTPESARKDHYCGETPPGIQRISACFNADRCKKLPSREKACIFSPNTKPIPSVICRKHRLSKTISIYARADGYPFPPFRFSAHQGRLAQTKFRFQ